MSDSSSEHSGLHDLRALAARVATTRATPPDRVSFPVLLAPVGSELTLGTQITPQHAPNPPRSRGRRPLGIAARVALATSILALSALAFAMAPRGASPLPPLAATDVKQKAPALVADLGAHEPPTTSELPDIAPPSSAPAPATTAPDARPTERRTRVPSAPRRTTPVVATTEPTSNATPRERSELDRLLDEALGGRASSTAPESLPVRPDARVLTTTLRGLEARIARCAPDDTGTATARLVIDGATGRVRDVSWVGATPTSHACIEGVLDDVEVPRFEQSSFAISFPYRLGL